MNSYDKIEFKPSVIPLKPNVHEFVSATVKGSRTGLVAILVFAPDGGLVCDQPLDVGFVGHLTASPIVLPYNEFQSIDIQVVDSDQKPLSTSGRPLLMQVQSVDAEITNTSSTRNAAPGAVNPPLQIDVPAGATRSDQFLVKSKGWKGGNVHLLATLTTGVGGAVIAQNEFSLQADPAPWLPIVLAIGGALLFALYNLFRQTVGSLRIWSWETGFKLLASVFAGVIAYLFADFDLLGLKLDPHVLRTYALLGFLFYFVGIDVLLSGKFGGGDKR